MTKSGAKTVKRSKKTATREWPVGEDSTLFIELRPTFGQTALFIDRRGGGLVVISLDEAESLADLLPAVVAAAKGETQ